MSVRPRVTSFNVGLALFRIADAARKQDRAGLRELQAYFKGIEALIYGKFNEPPSEFDKLIDVLLQLLPDPEEKIEEPGTAIPKSQLHYS